jgi:membrane-bound serine protease (ClpP class)
MYNENKIPPHTKAVYMDFLVDPNVAYLLLAGGLTFAMLALLNPGTGLLEIIALFMLLLAGFGIYNLPINLWSLAVLVAGSVMFVVAVFRAKGHWAFLIISIAAIMAGSVFLFSGETWWKPSVNPLLAALVSISTGTFFYFAARKVMEARAVVPTHDLNSLIGEVGEAKTAIQAEGSVQVVGELWSAWSRDRIPAGSLVRVVNREGFILEVEAVEPDA